MAEAGFHANEATLGYSHNLSDDGAGKGGIYLWMSLLIKHMIILIGFSRCGRAQWIGLGGTPGGDLSILNVYASMAYRERMEL